MKPKGTTPEEYFAKELVRILFGRLTDGTLRTEERALEQLLLLERDAEACGAPESVVWTIARHRRDAARACLRSVLPKTQH